jgi:hypothetical protein
VPTRLERAKRLELSMACKAAATAVRMLCTAPARDPGLVPGAGRPDDTNSHRSEHHAQRL